MKMRMALLFVSFVSFSSLFAQLRVVSLSPIVTKTMKMIGAESQLVGCTKWCPNEQGLPIVADAINVNIEALIKVNPDLVFASTLVSVESIKTIKALDIEVVSIPRTESFSLMCDNVKLIGQKLDRLSDALLQVEMAQERLHKLQKRINVQLRPKVMFQIGAKPIFVAMSNTFVGDYIVQAGAINCYSDIAHGTVTRESVLLRNPEAIFMSIMPTMSEQEKLVWESFPDLLATQNNKIFMLDQEKASGPTIHDFVDVVELMIGVLYE